MTNHICHAFLALALVMPIRALAQAREIISPPSASEPDSKEAARTAWTNARAQVERSMAEASASYRASGQCGSPELDVAISRPIELLSRAIKAAEARTITPAQTSELVAISGEGLLHLGDLALSAGCPEDAQGVYGGVMSTFPEASYPVFSARAREGMASTAIRNLSSLPPSSQTNRRVPQPPPPSDTGVILHGY